MSGEVARSGVKHPGPRARVACKPTPATQTRLYQGLGFLSVFSFALFLTVNMFQVWAACLCAVACSHAGWKGLSGEGLGGVSAQVLQVGHLDFH